MLSAVAATYRPVQHWGATPAGKPRAQDGSVASQDGEGQGARAAPTSGPAAVQDPAQLRELARLAARDREVRAHEQAHMAAGGGLVTGGPSFTYATGPDGKRYATGGEVGVDTSPGRTPQETMAKAERIRAAAMAPAQPSGQDMQVAAQASRMQMQARMELALQQRNAAYAGVDQATAPGAAGQPHLHAQA